MKRCAESKWIIRQRQSKRIDFARLALKQLYPISFIEHIPIDRPFCSGCADLQFSDCAYDVIILKPLKHHFVSDQYAGDSGQLSALGG